MADITKIKLPSGDTYNIKDDTSGYIKTETDPTVPSWAKQSSKPTYTATEVGASPTGHTHATTLATGATGDTSTITLASAGKYKLTTGGTNVVFTMPTIPTVNYPVTSVNTKTGAVTLTASDVGASATGHTHATGITGSTGTSQITLSHGSKYALSSGGTSYIFTMPAAQTIPTGTGNSTTGISIGAHGTTSIGSASGWSAGSASSWTFEEKTIPNVTSAGNASTWTFEEKSIPNITSAGSASTWTFGGVTVANSITGAVDTTDNTQLNISVGTTTVQSKTGGSNGTAPTLGTAIKVQSKSGGANGSAPTLGTAIKVQSKSGGSNGTAPSLTVSSKTVVTGTTHTITDNGHTHTLV